MFNSTRIDDIRRPARHELLMQLNGDRLDHVIIYDVPGLAHSLEIAGIYLIRRR